MTPTILMNSGVGPSEVLQANNVKVAVDSPHVGKHLQDHPAVGLMVSLDPSLVSSFPSSFNFAYQWSTYVNGVQRAIKLREQIKSMLKQLADNNNPTISKGNSHRHQALSDEELVALQAEIAKAEQSLKSEEYGVLGTPGISSGAFLTSPYCSVPPATQGKETTVVQNEKESEKKLELDCAARGVPDIQLTVYPTVAEPHIIAARKKKSASTLFSSAVNNSNEMLVTISLLRPRGSYEVCDDTLAIIFTNRC